MRQMLDMYLTADPSRVLSNLGDATLLQLIVENGIEAAKDKLPEGIKSNPGAMSETIENNMRKTEMPHDVMSKSDTQKVTTAIQAVHNGVFCMSSAIAGLVETSSSFARVQIKDGKFITQSLQRSSIESAKYNVAYTVGAPLKLMGCTVEHTGSYPGW